MGLLTSRPIENLCFLMLRIFPDSANDNCIWKNKNKHKRRSYIMYIKWCCGYSKCAKCFPKHYSHNCYDLTIYYTQYFL